jgi:ribosomal protein L40E
MERVYVHLAEEDMEFAIEKQYNLKGDEKPEKKGVCVKCGSILYLGDHCCRKCGLAENTKAAYEHDAEEQITNVTMNILMEDPLIKQRIMELRLGIREKLGLEE